MSQTEQKAQVLRQVSPLPTPPRCTQHLLHARHLSKSQPRTRYLESLSEACFPDGTQLTEERAPLCSDQRWFSWVERVQITCIQIPALNRNQPTLRGTSWRPELIPEAEVMAPSKASSPRNLHSIAGGLTPSKTRLSNLRFFISKTGVTVPTSRRY